MKKRQGIKHIEALQDNLEQLKVKCSCGHTSVMPVFVHQKICSHCGRVVNNNTKLYFMYNLRKELNKVEENK